MSFPPQAPPPTASHAPIGHTPSVWAPLYRLFLGLIASRGRIIALGVLGSLAALIGLLIGLAADDRTGDWVRFVNIYGLSILAPIVALVFAGAALSDTIDDGTLVYLWLRPVSRLTLVTAALAATFSVVVPLVLLPVGLGAALARASGGAIAGSVAAAFVATVTYSALFLFLGLMTRRSLAWGLAYILIWEGFAASASTGASRLAVRAYTRSILSDASSVPLRLGTVSPFFMIAVPIVIVAVAVALSRWKLSRIDVP